MAIPISENALKVLEKRYFAKDNNGKAVEDAQGMFNRIAKAIAKADLLYDENADIKATENDFYELMTSMRFLPNSPTLMNAGKPLGQLSACFVLPVKDSMEDIFESIKQAALIHKSGGGTGFSFSRLRQNGAPVNSTGGIASGPVSFMKVFNAATEAVKQGGTRRGANMGILRIDHPDIKEFITCKSDNAEITNFNISIGITEAFMQAVEKGSDFDLIDPLTKVAVGKLNARKVFEEIVSAAHKNGEPGIVFLDRLNRDNVVPSQGEIESTNPCGEQPLLPYESCNLGSINLTKMLRQTESGFELDYTLLKKTVHSAVHFLDNVIDVNNYPLDIIDKTTKDTRKIGLGVMGFADMLLYLSIPYNSEEAIEYAESVMAFINIEGQNASRKIARERGAFPLFFESIFKNKAPVRNATITTIAPTGTISMIGGCSSGIEPIFAYVYVRNIMDGTEMIEVNPVLKLLLQRRNLYSEELMRKIAKEGSLAHIDEIPDNIKKVFVCSHDISPNDHIKMQAAFQHHTDNAVSKTINMDNSATKKQVAQCYMLAYRLGCKGVTIYRDGSRAGQVLNIGSVNKDEKTVVLQDKNEIAQKGETGLITDVAPRPRPPVTMGFTERMKIGCGNLYITINYDKHGICEVFTSTGKAGGCPSQSEATARLASIALRSGISVDEVYDQLKGIRCPSTVRRGGMPCTSCPDAIAKVLRKVDAYIKESADMPINIPEAEKVLPNKSTIDMAVQKEQRQNASLDYLEQTPRKAEAENKFDINAQKQEEQTQPLANVQNAVQNAPVVSSTNENGAFNGESLTKDNDVLHDLNQDVIEQKEEQNYVISDEINYIVKPDVVEEIDAIKSEANKEEQKQQEVQNFAIEDEIKAEDLQRTYIEYSEEVLADISDNTNIIQDLKETGIDGDIEFLSNEFLQGFEEIEAEQYEEPINLNFSDEESIVKGVGSVGVAPQSLHLPHIESFKEYIANSDEFTPLANELEAQRLVAVPILSNADEEGLCPDCDSTLEHEGGCAICRNCGYSKCG